MRCSFCGKAKDPVRLMVSGPSALICSECIAVCEEIMREHGEPSFVAQIREAMGIPSTATDRLNLIDEIAKQGERLSVRARQVTDLRRGIKQLQRAYDWRGSQMQSHSYEVQQLCETIARRGKRIEELEAQVEIPRPVRRAVLVVFYALGESVLVGVLFALLAGIASVLLAWAWRIFHG